MASIKKIPMAALLAAALALPQPAAAQMFLNQPDFKPGPIQGSDPLVGLPLPGATPQEYAAHMLWNMRAGLNVAALQCQFSNYLRTTNNYNGILAHHSKELTEAYTTLGNYFKKKHGPKEGQRLFDDYNTITYNNFSTLQAQYGFCHTAADIMKEAISRPKGQLHMTAQGRLRELRNSLVPAYERIAVYNPYSIPLPTVPPLEDRCWDKRNQLKRNCVAPQTIMQPLNR